MFREQYKTVKAPVNIGESYLSWNFWELGNLSGLSVLIYIKRYTREKGKKKQF